MLTLEQIDEKIAKLQSQAEALRLKRSQGIVKQICALMSEHGITTDDIQTYARASGDGSDKISKGRVSIPGASPEGKLTTSVQSKSAPKYRHPKTGATWTGHGRAPSWIANVRDRSKYLVADERAGMDDTETVRVGKSGATAKKTSSGSSSTGRKGQPKGLQPAMYRDPLSGATWSGRGRAPAWIGSDRARFLIEAADSVSLDKPLAKKAAAKTATKKAATEKATTKTVATKTSAKKVSTKKAAAKKMSTRRAKLGNDVESAPSDTALNTVEDNLGV